jgi:hypothetical protein
MDRDLNQTQEFSLDDILKEFGSEEAVADEPTEVIPEVTPEAPEVTSAEEPQAEEPQAEEPDVDATRVLPVLDPEVREHTQVMPDLSDTIRLDDISQLEPQTEAPAQAQPTEEEPEPELPEEDELVLPPPIVLRPKSRLRELKKQLVAGPEKRYYTLSEIGIGRVQAAIFLNILVVLLCAGTAALFAAGMLPAPRLKLVIFTQVFAMMISATLGCYVLLEGALDLFKGRFSLNTLLLFTLVACLADAYYCLEQLRIPCCGAFCLEMTLALYNRYLRRSTEMGQMDTLRKAVRLISIGKVEDYYDGRPGILRGQGEVADFMDHYNAPSGPEKAQGIFALISLLVCSGIALLAGLLHGIPMGLQIFATALLVAVPASFFVTLSRPAAILQRRLHMVGTVICGWEGVKGLCGAAAFPMKDIDIFPQGSTKLNGVKFYSDRDPDETVAYAAAVMQTSGSSLAPIFEQLRKSRDAQELKAENFTAYGNGGVGGEVDGEPVLLGTLNFLQDMGVEIPEGTMVNQAVYCAVDGQLSAVFALSYSRMKSAAAGLVSLCGCRKITPVSLCADFTVNESFLRGKFGINTRRLAFPAREVRQELEAFADNADIPAMALTTQDNLVSAAYAVTGAKALRTACKLGLVMHMLGGAVGMLIMLALAYLGSDQLLTPTNILLYQLVWMVPGILLSDWARTV